MTGPAFDCGLWAAAMAAWCAALLQAATNGAHLLVAISLAGIGFGAPALVRRISRLVDEERGR